MCQVVRFFLFLFHVLVFLGSSISILVPDCRAVPYSIEDELANDFSDFVPSSDDEDVYEDEAFLYFDKNFGVSLGTGIDAWTGVMGKYFKLATPTFDFRLLSFSDRSATEFGTSFSTHHGSIPIYGASTLKVFKVFIDWKYYFRGDLKHLPVTGAVNAISPNPFFTVGLSYFDLSFEFLSLGQVAQNRLTEWRAPIVGRLPVPIVPTLALGLDFALNPRVSSLVLEGRWLPLGSLLDLVTGEAAQPFLDEVFQEKRFGDVLSANASILFVF